METYVDMSGTAICGIATWHSLFRQIAEIARNEENEFELIIMSSAEGPIPLGTQDEELAWDRAADALIERGIADAPWGFYSSYEDLWFISHHGAIRCNGRALRDRLEHPARWAFDDGGYGPWSFGKGGPMEGAGSPAPGPERAMRDPHLRRHMECVWARVRPYIQDALWVATGSAWDEQDVARLIRAMVHDEEEDAEDAA